jgi:hypothetical protein
MKNFSTQCLNKMMEKDKKQDSKVNMPRKQTLHFLTQFARVYHAEPMTDKALCGFILN